MAGRPKGQPKTGGRQKGTPNKSTADIKALAQKHGPAVIEEFLRLLKSDDERVRLGAGKELLDRGYGRAAQPHTGEDAEGPIRHVVEVVSVAGSEDPPTS